VLFAVDKDVDGVLLRGVRPGSKLYRTTYAVRETRSTTRGLNVDACIDRSRQRGRLERQSRRAGIETIASADDRDKDETRKQEEQPL
jgi:hypothetical protein